MNDKLAFIIGYNEVMDRSELLQKEAMQVELPIIGASLGVLTGATVNAILGMKASSDFQKTIKNARILDQVDPATIPEGVDIVTDDKLDAWLKRSGMSEVKKIAVKMQLKQMPGGYGAFVESEDPKQNAMVYIKTPVYDEVLKHELGHYSDYKKSGPLQPRRRQFESGMRSILHAPETSPMYQQEAEAWENSGIGEDNAIRASALNTYRNGLLAGRHTLGAGAAGGLIGLLAALILQRKGRTL